MTPGKMAHRASRTLRQTTTTKMHSTRNGPDGTQPMSEQSTGRGEWTRSGAFEVAPGVHRVPLPLPNDGLRAVNVYVISAADGGLFLIDSGWSIPEARSLLVEALDSLGHTLHDVRQFLVTHVH